MSEHMKAHHTNKMLEWIDVRVEMPGGHKILYHVPEVLKGQLNACLTELSQDKVELCEQAIPWEKLAKARIDKYKQAGLVLRGARYREGLSQVELAKKSKVHQNEISKIENGKRTVGEKVAKRLAKVLHFDYQLLLIPD